MARPLPGDARPRSRLVPALRAAAALAALAAVGPGGLAGCATSGARGAAPKRQEGAAFVERSLRDTGLRFGTDGSTRVLWSYLRLSHETIAPERARSGDVLFFDTRPASRAPDCDDDTDHAGIVEEVEPDGRIIFLEARGGEVRRSVVDPVHPKLRRNDQGEIANTFLRAKLVADPPTARYFAGEMLCGVARVER